jgi:hypothetical protein
MMDNVTGNVQNGEVVVVMVKRSVVEKPYPRVKVIKTK